MLYSSMEQLIGGTPLVRLAAFSGQANVFAKLEMFNPTGSAKDRAALYMLNDFEKKGILSPGGTIIEPTSGNTGIGLAALCAKRGYRAIFTMPDTMSRERIRLLTAYGAEVVLTPGDEGMTGSIAKAEELRISIPGAVIAGQFENPANPQAHFETTGPEIYAALNGDIAAYIAGVGTGGSLSGTAKYLKQQNPNIQIIAVEPADSPLISEGRAGHHGLQGIGANFIPANYAPEYTDRVITVSNAAAFETAKRAAREEGLLMGITSGAALWAAQQLARELPGKNIVALCPDNGDRYLSTGIYD